MYPKQWRNNYGAFPGPTLTIANGANDADSGTPQCR
jgi:hypothetical protein